MHNQPYYQPRYFGSFEHVRDTIASKFKELSVLVIILFASSLVNLIVHIVYLIKDRFSDNVPYYEMLPYIAFNSFMSIALFGINITTTIFFLIIATKLYSFEEKIGGEDNSIRIISVALIFGSIMEISAQFLSIFELERIISNVIFLIKTFPFVLAFYLLYRLFTKLQNQDLLGKNNKNTVFLLYSQIYFFVIYVFITLSLLTYLQEVRFVPLLIFTIAQGLLLYVYYSLLFIGLNATASVFKTIKSPESFNTSQQVSAPSSKPVSIYNPVSNSNETCFCGKCGSQWPKSSQFCGKCGNNLND